MKETDGFPQEEKLNNVSAEDEQEMLLNLEAAIENKIDDLETEDSDQEAFSEFDEEEDDWNPLRRKKVPKQVWEEEKTEPEKDAIPAKSEEEQKSDSVLTAKPEDVDEAGSLETREISEVEEGDEDFSGVEADPAEDLSEAESPEEDSADGGDDILEDDDYELDEEEEEYLQSAAFKRREKRVVTPEQRERRRNARIAAFWDLVYRRRKQVYWGIVGVVVILAAIVSAVVVRNWTYHSYKELVASVNEDTLSASYENINGRILKYGVDGAMFVDHNNDMLWTVSYEMNAPAVVCCGSTFAIYDSKGTTIVICNQSGKIGEVSADKPIVQVKIAKQGVVAAILEDGQNTWIKCYSKEGSEVATLKTTFTNPGYPLDIGLSEDGTLLAVGYLYIDNGTPVSRVSFYNFGTVGQNQKDNLVAETEYRDKILPEIDYMDDKTCVVFREDGFSLFTGGQIPLEDVKVTVKQNIVSTFHDSEYVGLVLQNRNSEKQYMISLYNKKGREVLNKEIDFHYQSVELNGNQIVFSSKNEFCVYSLQGVEKFRGDLEVPASEFRGFGRNKYLYVTEDLFKIIQLT